MLLLAVRMAGAAAGVAPEVWRHDVEETRRLADNDARRAYRDALQLHQSLPSGAPDTDRVRILNVLARAEVYLALTDGAADHAEQALAIAKRNGDKVGQVEADLNIALNSVNQGRFDTLVEATTHSMTLLDGLDRTELITEAMLRTASMYGRAGAFDASMTMPMHAMDIARRTNNTLAMVYAHQGMALALEQISRWNDAAEHYFQMRDQARLARSRILEADATLGIGNVLTKQGRLQEGEALIRDALSTYRGVGAPLSTAQGTLSLAANLKAQKRPAESLALLEEAMGIYEKAGSKSGLWATCFARSNDYLALGKVEEAARDARRAYDLATDIGAENYESQSARQMANIAAIRYEFQAAYKLSNEAAQMKEKADSERASTRMLELAQRYRTEAKQREIDELMHAAEQHAIRTQWMWTVLIGSLAILVGTAFFVMRLRRANQQLREARDDIQVINATLEHRVAERTEQLEAANKAKGMFLANMSHELRTPLNAILGFSSLLRRDSRVTEDQANSLNIINRSGEHLLKLINDVLEMSKIEAGRLKLAASPFDLGAMVRDVADMMRLRAEEKGLQLLVDQSSDFPRFIRGDEARLRQVLVNLVGNAVKFTQEGGVTIRLGVKRKDKIHLLIEVEDSGPGIDDKDRQRIFKPFEQLAEGAEQEGTGLGLAITRQYVGLMGGNITVESTLGKGSLFRVDLPIELVQTEQVYATVEKSEVVGLAPGHRDYRILIAEDQEENALLLTRLMAVIGLETRVAENGERCVAMFQEWHPDLIWMDRRMPIMDGMEATRRIRALPGGDSVKIVAVTASAFKEQQQEMLDAGMDDFIRKPYRVNEIYDSLAEQLGVEYVYRSIRSPSQDKAAMLTPAMMAKLPAFFRQELTEALEQLDRPKVSALIEEVAVTNPQLAIALARLADRYDYATLLGLLAEVVS